MKNLTPIAAVIAIVCFFAPWMSCGLMTMSGFDLAKGMSTGMETAGESSATPILWIVPLAGLIILGLYFMMKNKNSLRSAMIPTIVASLLALAVMGIKYIDVKKSSKGDKDKTAKTEQTKQDDENSSLDSSMKAMTTGMEKMMDDMIQIKWGFYLTAVAFIGCIVGATQLKNEASAPPPSSSSESGSV